MLYSLPYNVIPFALVGLAGCLFGIRGLLLYKQNRAPLSLYYGLSGASVGVACLLYSLPFLFTRESDLLKLFTILGDLFYYVTIIAAVKLIWYLGLSKKISFFWLLVPLLSYMSITFFISVKEILPITYRVADNEAIYPTGATATIMLGLLSLPIFIVGILTLRNAIAIKEKKSRLRMILIGSVYVLGGLNAMYNYWFLDGINNSALSIISYSLAAFIMFVGILFVTRAKGSSDARR